MSAFGAGVGEEWVPLPSPQPELLSWICVQELVLLLGVRLLVFGDMVFPSGSLYKSCSLPISWPFSAPEPLPKHGQPVWLRACLQIQP